MSPMTPVNPAMPPIQPLQPAQTPQSQYLAAALKQLGSQAPATPAALGLDLGATALMNMAPTSQSQGQGFGSRLKGLLGLGQGGVQAAAGSQVQI